MANLPVLVLREIFKFLNIRDKLKVKSTSKEWKFIVETMFCQQNLCIYSKDYPYNEKWCFSKEPLIEQDMVYIKFVRTMLKFDFKSQFFQNLHKVCIWEIGENIDSFLKELNLLANLKVLMISEGRINCRVLSSSSLERLSLKCISFERIELDTPNLSSLILWDYKHYERNNLFNFRFPSSIRHLECFRFDRAFSVLKNLETLVCKKIIVDFQLNDFKSLVRLEFFPLAEHEVAKIKRIQQESERLKRSDLELIVSGFKENPIVCHFHLEVHENYHDCENLFRDVQPEKRSRYLEHVSKNRAELVGHLPWRLHLHIQNLSKHMNIIASDLFKKRFNFYAFSTFYGLSAFETTSEVDPFDLLHLLKRSGVKNVALSPVKQFKKEFYRKLCTIQSIKELRLDVHLENIEFDWLLNLQNLLILDLRTEKICFEFICKLFEQLKFCHEFRFVCPMLRIYLVVERGCLEGLEEEDYEFPYKFLYSEKKNFINTGASFFQHCRDSNELRRTVKEQECCLKVHEKTKDLLI